MSNPTQGPLTSYAASLVTYAEFLLTPVEGGDSTVRSTLKAATISATHGLYYLAQLVDRAVSFIVEKFNEFTNSKQYQKFKEEKVPYLKAKAIQAKDYVVEKAQGLYGRLSSFQKAPAN